MRWGELRVLAWLVNAIAGSLVPRRPRRAFYSWELWRFLVRVGTDSLPIVGVISMCTGVILALQSAQQLEKVGATSYVANLVGVTLLRELGPLMTAIILTGRSGAAFAAEVASMKINEEVDALTVMGVDAVRYLVRPKFLAMVIMMPVLTLWADLVGTASGGVFASIFLSLDGTAYFEQSVAFLKIGDVFSGLVKSVGFGAAIAVVSCWQGMLARDGAADVGERTTKAVVLSIFVIIVLDLFFTALDYLFR